MLRIATFFVLSIICHAATLHPAPGQRRRVIFARGLGMIFSPITAGLYSLMALGRMGTAWVSIVTRTIELVARIMAPETESQQPISTPPTVERSFTIAATPSSSPPIHLTRSNSTPIIHQPQPVRPRTQTTLRSPVDELRDSPIASSIHIASRLATSPKEIRQNNEIAKVDVHSELPHRMLTRAVIAGAIAIHVPHRFTSLLHSRNWEVLSHTKEISTEHCRIPEVDPAFSQLTQWILPPTALLLDWTFRIYPESMFREAAAGLLQLGFGLYQLVSSDAHFSVERDGLASPFLLVLPYLGMAGVNSIINILDPPYTVVTVLDISPQARHHMLMSQSPSETSSPVLSRSSTMYFPTSHTFPLTPPTMRKVPRPRTPALQVDTSSKSEKFSVPTRVQSPRSSPSSALVEEQATWAEFLQWLEFAYERRIDVSPVDRLYRTHWISHSIIIGEFIHNIIAGLLIPLVMLAVVGSWTHFKTSNYGLSLAFNLLTLFGLPFLQFLLYTHHLFVKLLRVLRSRNDTTSTPTLKEEDERVRVCGVRWWSRKMRHRSMWWSTIAQSVGLYFPTSRTVIIAYTSVVVAVAVCEFVFVGINLQRTLMCQGLLM